VKKVSRSHHSSLNELNITPLLDLAFVLLVIFIITTPQMTNELEINLPSPTPPATNAPPPQINYLVVDVSGDVTLNQQPVPTARLKQTLMQLKKDQGDPNVVVRGLGEVEYQKIVAVLDALGQADISKVGMATDAAQ
jgi:biopolymer transport protein ExbD